MKRKFVKRLLRIAAPLALGTAAIAGTTAFVTACASSSEVPQTSGGVQSFWVSGTKVNGIELPGQFFTFKKNQDSGKSTLPVSFRKNDVSAIQTFEQYKEMDIQLAYSREQWTQTNQQTGRYEQVDHPGAVKEWLLDIKLKNDEDQKKLYGTDGRFDFYIDIDATSSVMNFTGSLNFLLTFYSAKWPEVKGSTGMVVNLNFDGYGTGGN